MSFHHVEARKQRNSAFFLYAVTGALLVAVAGSQLVPSLGVPEAPGRLSPTQVRLLVGSLFAAYAIVVVPIKTYHSDIRVSDGVVNIPFMVKPIRYRAVGRVEVAKVVWCAIERGPTPAVRRLAIRVSDGRELRFDARRLERAYATPDGRSVVTWLLALTPKGDR